MTEQPDTKAAWKRRALRAEAQLDRLQEIRRFEGQHESRFVRWSESAATQG